MNIAELKAKQENAQNWSKLAEETKAALESAFRLIWNEMRATTGLSIWLDDLEAISVSATATGIEIKLRQGEEWEEAALRYRLMGLKTEATVRLLRSSITKASQVDRPWRVIVRGTLASEGALTKNAYSLEEASVAMCIEGGGAKRRYLWWRGPADNAKLTEAIVDAFQDRTKPSDFVVGGLFKRTLAFFAGT